MMTYKERILYIADVCASQDIPFSINEIFDGWQIRFPWCEGDIACHSFTFGANEGFVESYEFPWDDDDVSILMPAEVVANIKEYYKEV